MATKQFFPIAATMMMNMMFSPLIFTIILVFGIGCRCQDPLIEPDLNVLNNTRITKCFTPKDDNSTVDLSNIDDVSKIMLEGSRYFALKLFKSLNLFESKTTSKGLIFSPASVWSTLLVAYLGSEGETETEIGRQLKVKNLPKANVALAYKTIKWWKELKTAKLLLNQSEHETSVSSANKLFVDDHLIIKDCFKDIFGDEIETKSFSNRTPECLREINSWISEQTKGRINNLLGPDSITPTTQLVMVNAIYFKSSWAQKFDSAKTQKQTFYVSSKEQIQTDMMVMDSTSVMFGVSEALRATAVEIPYSNPDYSMVIILPDETKTLDSLIRDLSFNRLQNLHENMFDDEVMLMLPKFRSEQEFELAPTLFSLGITKLFDPRFGNMSSLFEGGSNVALDSVIHKSFIMVNEDGTEAAAATAMIFARSGRPMFPTQFIANRPFLYMIRDVSANMILFLGTVRRPSLN